MFNSEIYKARRAAVVRAVGGDGVVIIPSNGYIPNSYPSNAYYFRQDGSFRYLFGVAEADLWGVIDLATGESALYGEDQTLDDKIWTGVLPTIAELAHSCGVERWGSRADLAAFMEGAEGRRVHILPPYRAETKFSLAELLDKSPAQIDDYVSEELILSIAELRERKSEEEITKIEAAYAIGYRMHTTAMAMVGEGVVEREIGGALEGIARSMGGGVSFSPICTQHGERLHNVGREGVLRDGRLFLCDAGGETLSGYCSDHTRTYPVSGRFTAQQRDIYNIVLAAQRHVAMIAAPDMLYTHLQRECYRVLATGLLDVGLLRGDIDQILESGAVSMFMPHGVSHGLGLDVHDCEAFGERGVDMSKYGDLLSASTCCINRRGWRFKVGTVMSNEPGIYFIPELIRQRYDEGLYRDVVNYSLLEEHYLDFGGIRVEDCLVIERRGCREVGESYTDKIPRTIDEIEEFMRRTRR